MNLLIADDDPTLLDVLEDMYTQYFADLRITKALNGALALHHCWQETFDLICTDYRMPALDGLEFTQIVRKKEGPNQQTGIIFLSGFIPEFKFKAEVYTGVFFLGKPAHPDRLMRVSSIAAKRLMISKVG